MPELLYGELTTCQSCGATVELRINRNKKVYYHCDGSRDDAQCNAAFKWGAKQSRTMIADAAKRDRTKDHDRPEAQEVDPTEVEDDENPEVEPEAGPGADPGRNPGADPGDRDGDERDDFLG